MEKKSAARFITRTAVIAGLYALLTLFLPTMALAYTPLQFRAAESMTLLPLLFVEAIPGLAIGCLIANIFSPFGWYDMVFGTLATLLAAVLTRFISQRKFLNKGRSEWAKLILSGLPPIFVNAFILPFMWYVFAGDAGYWLNMLTILATQSAVVLILGIPLYFGLKKTKIHLL